MNLKQWRKANGLTIKAAAEKCGISHRTWEGWECDGHMPSLAAAEKIVTASKGAVTLTDLLKKNTGT